MRVNYSPLHIQTGVRKQTPQEEARARAEKAYEEENALRAAEMARLIADAEEARRALIRTEKYGPKGQQ